MTKWNFDWISFFLDRNEMHKGMRIRDQLKKKTKRRDIIIIALLKAAHSRVHIHGSFHVSHGKWARGSKQLVGSLGRTGAAQPATLFHRVNYRSSSSRRTSPLSSPLEQTRGKYCATIFRENVGLAARRNESWTERNHLAFQIDLHSCLSTIV